MGYDLSDTAAAQEYWAIRAPQWDAWADHLAPPAERFNASLIEAIDVRSGQTLLDLASGAGEPALTLARHVGPSGSVTATDLVPEMLAGARRRVLAAGLTNVSFEICGMDDLPFDDSVYDAAICRFGQMFVPDVRSALSSILRVLKPRGQTACMVWGPRDANTLFKVLQTVVSPLIGEEADGGDSPMFNFAEPGSLNQVFVDAGYDDPREIKLTFAPEIDGGKNFWRPLLEMSLGQTFADLSIQSREQIDSAVRTGFQKYLDGGKYCLSVHARIGVGIAPEA